MKKVLLFACVGLLGCLTASDAFAGKGGKKGGGAAPATVRSDVYGKYDVNFDGALSAEENAAIRKDFESDKTGSLKVWDSDADGKLSDTEIAAIPPTKAADKPVKARKGGRGKKNK
jgi:hypothetical protein